MKAVIPTANYADLWQLDRHRCHSQHRRRPLRSPTTVEQSQSTEPSLAKELPGNFAAATDEEENELFTESDRDRIEERVVPAIDGDLAAVDKEFESAADWLSVL